MLSFPIPQKGRLLEEEKDEDDKAFHSYCPLEHDGPWGRFHNESTHSRPDLSAEERAQCIACKCLASLVQKKNVEHYPRANSRGYRSKRVPEPSGDNKDDVVVTSRHASRPDTAGQGSYHPPENT